MKCAFCGFAASPQSAVSCALCGKDLARAKDALPRGRRGESLRYEGPKRHLLLRIGGLPIVLTPGETLTIGRSNECGLSIPSQRVSRAHAEVFMRADQPVIKDLGSENGTQINGQSVREHELVDQDEIRVGPYTCTYRCVKGQRISELVEGLESAAETAITAADLSGDLESVSLIEVLGLLDRGRKTGSLEVFEADCEDGRIVFLKGEPIFAQVGEEDLTGRGAVFRLFAQERGKFRFDNGPRVVDPNIDDGSVTALIIQHAQAMDRRHTNRRDLTNLGDLEDSGADLEPIDG